MAAYVDGRPMPRSSISFTSDDSLKRGGGWVKCCSGRSFTRRSSMPCLERRQQAVLGLLLALAALAVFSSSAPASSSGGFAPYTAR